MIDLTMDMEQYDCPFIDTTADHDLSFSTIHWHLDTATEELETRMIVEAEERSALEGGLSALRDHENMTDYRQFSKFGDSAVIYTGIEQTHAMETIRDNGGFITGPFHIEDGSETWQVGFDDDDTAEDTLSELETGNDFVVEDRSSVELDELFDVLRNRTAAVKLLDACRSLSAVETETLRTAADRGYFESPREATLSTLADEFDVSTAAVSKNMRRGEKKVLRTLVEALDELE